MGTIAYICMNMLIDLTNIVYLGPFHDGRKGMPSKKPVFYGSHNKNPVLFSPTWKMFNPQSIIFFP